MCRISGAYDQDQVRREAFVAAANEKQKAGGPDGRGIKTIDHVTFGHRLLAIIGNQPQPLLSDRYLLTFNGEIYNYEDLIPFCKSDSEVLFLLLNGKGVEKTLSDINGMFSIGLYDRQEQQIHLIVDRFAQKNLYYYHKGNSFYFASNPSALYDLEPSLELDREALQSYWLLGGVMGTDSLFKGIKRVCASECVTYDIKSNTVTTKRYWEPKFQEKTNDIEDLVLDAINKTKVSDVPIHIFLSGGIDSTLVASQFQSGQAIHLDGPEKQYAQFVANKFNIDLKIVEPETIETEQYLTDYVTFSGLPTMAGLIPYTTAKEVSKYGKVAISANGADELFFGYDRTHDTINSLQSGHIFRLTAFRGYKGSISYKHTPPSISQGRMLELMSYVQFDLNTTLDFASMAHGLEVRSPFLDHRLVEMALSIPEKEHRRNGNKTILKRMLTRLGFNDNFLNRPKQGFSLHRQPEQLDILISKAWDWVHENGFLNVKLLPLSGRDKKYLEMSALGFYYWFKAWEHKIK